MAQKYKNDKDFLILELEPLDCIKAKIGPVCMQCNQFSFDDDKDNLYYISALNDVMCKDCLDKWINKPLTKRYEEDISYETIHYDYYAKMLGLQTIQ